VVALALGSGTALAGGWTFTDLSLLGGIVGDSFATKINNNGDITGVAVYNGYDGNRRATLWSGGVAYNLRSFGSTLPAISSAGSINDSGVIVGSANYDSSAGLSYHAAMFSTNAPPVDILPPNSYPANASSMVGDINNSGQMVGYALSDTYGQVPLYWSDASTYKILDAGSLGQGSANRINNGGQTCGFIQVATSGGYLPNAAFWDANGKLTNLGTFGEWTSTAHGINDAGQVLVSTKDRNSNEWSLVWQDGEYEMLTGLGGARTSASAINNDGRLIVGQSQTADGVMHAVLWKDGEIIDLNSLVSGTDLVLYNAQDINEKGQIVGNAYTADGHTSVAFLLTPDAAPVPIPAALPLLASGLAALGVFRRRFLRV
jgi:probable HAF family extracellular repeat protein